MATRTQSNPFSGNDWTLSQGLNSLYTRQNIQLKPWFYSKESTTKIAGSVLAGLSLFSTYKTVHAVLWLTDLPNVIKRTAFGYTASTILLIASTILCFHKKEFWYDPAFRAKRGVEAADDIRKNGLGLVDILSKYGSEIKNYKILSERDFENLLVNEPKNCKNYQQFKTRNGNNNLFLFDSDALVQLIQKECEASKSDSNTLLNSLKRETIHLKIPDTDILSWALNSQIKDVLDNKTDYFAFRTKHNRVDLLKLESVDIDKLKRKFLAEISDLNKSVTHISKIYRDDMWLFGITLEEIEKVILPLEATREVDKKMTYIYFKFRNGENSVNRLIEINPSFREIMKLKFFNSPFAVMCSESSAKDYSSLGITKNDIYNAVREDMILLKYEEFVIKHSYSIFSEWVFTAADIAHLKPKFLESIKEESLGGRALIGIQSEYSQQIKGLDVSENELNAIILPLEVRRCKTYAQFETRNGPNAHSALLKINGDYKSNLHDLFRTLPLHVMTNKHYLEIGRSMGFQMEDIRIFVDKNAEDLTYPEFKKQFGEALFGNNRSLLSDQQKATLRDKLSQHVRTCSVAEIESLKEDAAIFDMSLIQLYAERWKHMRMDKIIESEFEVFKVQIQTNRELRPKIWREKTLNELKGLTLQEVIQKYKVCFELGILKRKHGVPKFFELADGAAKSSPRFEELCSNYNLFILDLFEPHCTSLNELVKDYLLRHSDTLLEGKPLEYYAALQDKNIIKMATNSNVRDHIKNYGSMKSEHEKKLKVIKKLNEVMCEGIESVFRKNKKIITDKLSYSKGNLEEKEKNFSAHSKYYEALSLEISVLENEIEELEGFNSDPSSQKKLEANIANYRKELTELQRPVPVQGLRATLLSDSDKDKQIKILKKALEELEIASEKHNKALTLPNMRIELKSKKEQLEAQKLKKTESQIVLEPARSEHQKLSEKSSEDIKLFEKDRSDKLEKELMIRTQALGTEEKRWTFNVNQMKSSLKEYLRKSL